MAAQKEFGLTNVALKHLSGSAFKEAEALFAKNGKAFQAFLRAQYNLTQEFFKKNGITHLTGYRGMNFVKKVPGFEFGKDIKIVEGKLQLQSLSSFSTDLEQAKRFVSYRPGYRMIIQSDIPANRILSTCQTGFGCKNEAEFVILSGPSKFKVATYRIIDIPREVFLETFADFKVPVPKVPIPKWKPVMTQAEADAWAKGSKYADDVFYHGTSEKAASSIKIQGFDISRLGEYTQNGGINGAGNYFALDKAHASTYLHGKGELLKVKLNVKNVLIKTSDKIKYGIISEDSYEVAKKLGDVTLKQARKLCSPTNLKSLNQISLKDWEVYKKIAKTEKWGMEAARTYGYQSAGYDAIYSSNLDEICVFTNNSSVVIK